MTATVIGELTADSRSIVLMAAGQTHEQQEAARYLQSLTPLVEHLCTCGHVSTAHHDEGTRRGPCRACACLLYQGEALQLPATWAAVVQLSATFGAYWKPGPRLAAWTYDQVVARTAVDPGAPGQLAVPPPRADLVPRPYQVAGARMIGLVGSALLFDEMGPQPTSTPILTPSGWSTMGELAPGSAVFDVHGQPSRVRTVKRFGEQDVFRVHLNDRTSTLATAEHPWRVYTANDRHRGNGGRVLTTAQMREQGPRCASGNARFYLPQQPVLQGLGGTDDLPLDPYAYGALLGDGSLGGANLSMSCPDRDLLGWVRAAVESIETSVSGFDYLGRCPGLRFHRDGKLRAALGELDSLHGAAGKRVHERYRLAPEQVRRRVLAGLLDTDGTVIRTGAGVEFTSASPGLAADVAWLARSLGAVVTESEPQPAHYLDPERQRVECLPKHRVLARFPADGPNPFRLPRKANAWAAGALSVQRPTPPRTIRVIEPAGRAEVCCIELDTDDEASRVYLTDTVLIPTHNTGKTVSTVLGVRERIAAVGPGAVLPIVVVCPASVIDSWLEHFATWAPELRARPWTGSPGRRRRRIGTADVYVCSYGTAAKDAATADQQKIARGKSPLLSLCARTVIADEVHKIKAPGSTFSRAVRNLAGRAHALDGGFVGLSGTPITHSPKDLWPALYCCSPHAWPSSERWAYRFCDTIPGDYGSPTVLGLNPRAEPEFRDTILGQYRRVAKADVLAHLPPKVYSVRTVELPEQYRKAYDAVESEMLAELPEGGGELSPQNVLNQLGGLLALASSACDVETWFEAVEDPTTGLEVEKRHQSVHPKAPSWKVDDLLDVMAERPGARFLVGAPSRQLLEVAARAVAAKGYRVGRYFGVGGEDEGRVTLKSRAADKDAFQAGALDVIFVTTDAGGIGLTLTAASVVVMLQRPWSFVQSQQIEDRAHRIGSERHECVEIIDIVAANTVETRVRAILKERAGQLSALVQDPRIVRELLGGDDVRDLRKAPRAKARAAA